MMSQFLPVLRAVPSVLLGLMAGFLYALSVSVMAGLDRIDPAHAITAMQGINAAVRNPVFFGTYFLTPVVTLAIAGGAWVSGEKRSARWLVAAAVVYGAGVLIPTGVVNVPLNNALAAISEAQISANGAVLWAEYSTQWGLWNTVRCGIATLALVFAGLGFRASCPAC